MIGWKEKASQLAAQLRQVMTWMDAALEASKVASLKGAAQLELVLMDTAALHKACTAAKVRPFQTFDMLTHIAMYMSSARPTFQCNLNAACL